MVLAMPALDDLTTQIPDSVPAGFCIAPFISTMQTPYGKTSPCAYGVTEWQLDHLSPLQRWQAPELNHMRQQFIRGETPAPCQKCVLEEQSDKSSLRQRMLQWFPQAYQDMIKSGRWQQGPQLISTKVSNVCNLACRSCAGWDSNRFRDEGLHYLQVYGTQHPGTPGNRFIPRLPPRHTDYSQFADIDANITKLEFFGGEPLLNHTHFEFLEHLIATGRSRQVTLFYSTNCTQPITDRFRRIWQNFAALEFSLSIDHVQEKFEYLRWPGRWQDVETNVDSMLDLRRQFDIPVQLVVSPCATLNNVFYIDQVLDWAHDKVGAAYINMVAFPDYISVFVAPDDVKQIITGRVMTREVINFMNIKPHDALAWKRWLIWTKRQDLYREQSFANTFPEFFNVIQHYWHAVQDLSEDNYNRIG